MNKHVPKLPHRSHEEVRNIKKVYHVDDKCYLHHVPDKKGPHIPHVFRYTFKQSIAKYIKIA